MNAMVYCCGTTQSFWLVDWPVCDILNRRQCLWLSFSDLNSILTTTSQSEHLREWKESENCPIIVIKWCEKFFREGAYVWCRVFVCPLLIRSVHYFSLQQALSKRWLCCCLQALEDKRYLTSWCYHLQMSVDVQSIENCSFVKLMMIFHIFSSWMCMNVHECNVPFVKILAWLAFLWSIRFGERDEHQLLSMINAPSLLTSTDDSVLVCVCTVAVLEKMKRWKKFKFKDFFKNFFLLFFSFSLNGNKNNT